MMSTFFLLEEEQAATLEEALAFIETYSDVNSNEESSASDHSSDLDHSQSCSQLLSSSSASSESGSSTSDGSNDVDHRKAHAQQQQQSAQKSRAANAKAVTRYHKRSKTEIVNLREQVLQLTALVTHLRKRDARAARLDVSQKRQGTATSTSSRQPHGSAVGLDHAVAEYRKLEQSEAMNRKLKDALAKQAKMNKTFGAFFLKQIAKLVRIVTDSLLIKYASMCIASHCADVFIVK